MQLFEYKGRDKNGQLTQGTIEAANPAGVVQWMLSMGISPVDVQPKKDNLANQPAWIRKLSGGGSLGRTELLLFTRQMGTMARAGVPLIQAIEGLKKTSRNPAMTDLLRSIGVSLDRGQELSMALAQHPKFFTEYYVNMVRVGESTGKLQDIFESLFKQLDFDRRMSQKIKSVLRYPTFVLIAILAALGVMTVYIIPSFSKVYAGMKAELPLITQILVGLSNFVAQNWWLLLLLLAGGAIGIRAYLRTPAGRLGWDRYKLKLPIIGPLLAKASTARFCSSFSTAISAGMPLATCLTLVAKVVENAFYEERIRYMRDRISAGDSLLQSFSQAGIFAPLEIQMVTVGEQTGDIEGMAHQLAVLYQEEVEYEAGRLAEYLEPVLMLFMAGLVLILMLGIFLPMWNLTSVVR